jgi:putative phage-type endonuclease
MTEPMTPEARRRAWLADRRTALTGTDAAQVLGLATFPGAGPMKVWLEKTGDGAEEPENDPMRWGRRFERPILEEFADRMNAPLTFADPYALIRVKGRELFGATLDAVRDDTGAPVDAKNIGFIGAQWGEAGTDEVPLYYALQLMMQMAAVGAEQSHLAVLFNRYDFRTYTVRRDPELERTILEKMEAWWEAHVVKRVPPPVDGTEAWGDYLKRKFTASTGLTVKATAEVHDAAVALFERKAALKELEREVAAAENAIKAAIGDNIRIEGPTWHATWPFTADSTGTDWEAIAKDLTLEVCKHTGELPVRKLKELAADPQYTKVTRKGGRRFTFNFKEE